MKAALYSNTSHLCEHRSISASRVCFAIVF